MWNEILLAIAVGFFASSAGGRPRASHRPALEGLHSASVGYFLAVIIALTLFQASLGNALHFNRSTASGMPCS